MNGKMMIVFDAREAFFLRSGDNLSIDNEARSRIVIEGRNSEYADHLEESVDERGDR
jgi:hypothetical protein